MPEHCKDCNEEHLTFEERLSFLQKRRRIFFISYLISLFFLAYCAYGLFGVYGSLTVLAGYGIYVSQLNLQIFSREVMIANQEKILNGASVIDKTKKDHKFSFGQYI